MQSDVASVFHFALYRSAGVVFGQIPMRYEQKHDAQTMVLSDKIHSGEWYVWLESEKGESSNSLLLGVCEFETAKKRANNWLRITGHVCGDKCGDWEPVP